MAEKHPDELELLSFVEEELGDTAHRDVAEHLVACRTCADQIRRLQAGRDALQAAPLLELPDARRAEILSGLPERPDPWRLFRPVKRALVVAAPAAAAATIFAALIVGAMQLDGGGGGDDDEAAGGDAASAETFSSQDSGATEEMTPESDQARTVVLKVRGPAVEVVRALENEGIEAEVESSVAVVAEARAGEVKAALADRPGGNVTVYVR